MKKLLLFTALLSTSFASFCPAVAMRPAPVANYAAPVTVTTMPATVMQQPTATPLNTMIAQLLASITKPGAKTADIRLQDLTTNVKTLHAGISNVFVRDLDEKAKTDILRCIETMQEETTQLLNLFEDSTKIIYKRNNVNCKHLLEIQKVLGKLTEKINGVNLVWVAGKNTLSWMNNNRIKTVAILALAPLIAKASTTAGYHAYQSGFNPFRWVTGTLKWAFTPAFTKVALVTQASR